jgi:hypothetical protein
MKSAMDVVAALRSLDLSREDEAPDLPWLADSYDAPGPFWAAIAEHVGRGGPALGTQPGVSYGLYHDAVGRHAASASASSPAFVTFDASSGWRAISYADLARRASSCAQALAREGLAPGAVVALVLPLGVPWLVAFAAALRLGLVVSFLEPAGRRALSARLDALAPARVLFDPGAPPSLGRWADRSLAVVDEGPEHRTAPHAYAPDECCARLFSPLRAPIERPVSLGAEAAWQCGLRDGLLVYRLAVGDGMALPGFPAQQHQPAAIFATLLAGATFVHLSLPDVASRPSLLRERPIATLGVSPGLRDALRRRPIDPPAPFAQWIRSVDEPLDWQAWRDFVDKNALAKTRTANVLIDASAGGAVLFSARRFGSINAYALPGAGRPYALVDAATGQLASGGAGVFSPISENPKTNPWFLIAPRAGEWLWGSTLQPRHAGRVFPGRETEGFAAQLPGVLGAATVAVPTGDTAGRWAFVLLLFVQTTNRMDSRAVVEAIRAELSVEHEPDQVVILPLHPRKVGDKVDGDWCRRQYLSGLLAKKAAHPAFRDAAALRELFAV